MQKWVKNECNKVGFISMRHAVTRLHKTDINHNQRLNLASFLCLLYTRKWVYLAPLSIPVAALLSISAWQTETNGD